MARSASLPNGLVITAGVGPQVGDDRLGFIEVCFSEADFIMRKTLPLDRRDAEFINVQFAISRDDRSQRQMTIDYLTKNGYEQV